MFGFFKNKFDKDAQAAIERRAQQMAPKAAAKVAKPAATAPAKPAVKPAAKAAAPAAAKATALVAAKPTSPVTARSTREADIARMQAQVNQIVTPERQALIQNAMKVHRAKRQILDQLDDESRAKLVAMAITALMRDGDDAGPKKK